MKDIFNVPFSEFFDVLRKYLESYESGDFHTMEALKKEYPDLFSEEFNEYISNSLKTFGITEEMIDEIYENKLLAKPNAKKSLLN